MSHLQGIGAFLLSTIKISEVVRVAKMAEDAGLDEFWLGENYHWFRHYGDEPRSAMITAASLAMNTSHIKFGLGIVSVYTRHPSILALESVSLNELSNGRFSLGLGASKMGVVHMGFDTRGADVVTSESVRAIRSLFSGEKVDFKGTVFQIEAPESEENARPLHKIPILIGATGHKLLQLSGEIADGLILPTMTSPAFVKYALEQVRIGAARSNRSLANFKVYATLISSIDKDPAVARNAVRKIVATYFTNKLVNIRNDKIIGAIGMTYDDIRPIADAVLSGRMDDALRRVDDDMVEKASVAGNPDQFCERLEKYAEAGLNIPLHIIYGKPETVINLLGKEVRPRLVVD